VTDPWRQELRDFLLTASYVVLAGPIVGLLWSAVGPKLDLLKVITGSGVAWKAEVGADVHFALLGSGAGAICAAIAFALRREGPGAVAGLAAGGLGAAFVADRVGYLLNHGDMVDLMRAHGITLRPDINPCFEVRALGVVAAWPIAALVVHALAVALRDRSRSLP
jgi:hypothetical protein